MCGSLNRSPTVSHSFAQCTNWCTATVWIVCDLDKSIEECSERDSVDKRSAWHVYIVCDSQRCHIVSAAQTLPAIMT